MDDWDSLNETVNGRLIKTVPIAASCHKLFSSPGINASVYNEASCAELRDRWYLPETHLSYPSSPMAYPFTNNTCSPFAEPDAPCSMGYYVAYTINATDASAVQEALRFARKHNIRLVIRNSGHDYLGKSTGAHALGVWVHHMKSISLMKNYSNSGYTGPAIRLGAGVSGIEAYTFAHSHGLVVVGGNCPTVALAGGITSLCFLSPSPQIIIASLWSIYAMANY